MVKTVLDFLQSLTEKETWIRVVMVIVGALLMFYALTQYSPVNEFAGAMRAAATKGLSR